MMKKIAQVSHAYLPHVGGIEYYIYRLVSRINDKYNVHILTSDMGGIQNNNICNTLYFNAFPVIMRNPFLFGLAKHLINNRYDIIHNHQIWFLPNFEAAIFKKDSKIITTIHGVWPATSNLLTKIFLHLYKPFAQFVIDRSDVIIVLSKREEDKLKKIFSVDHNKIHIIPNGIFPENVDELKMSEVVNKYKLKDKKVIFFTGRIISDKNPEILLRSIPEIKNKIDDIVCVITGPINHSYKSNLEKIIEKYNINSNCIITGEVEREELIALYRIASVFVAIGSWEGLPTRLLEAMYHECPVVVYDYGSVSDIIVDRKDGIIIYELDPKILADNIIILLKDEELNRKISINAKQKVIDKYMWNQTVKKIESLYQNL